MQRLFLLCVLTLTACAPVAQFAQLGEIAKLFRDGLSLLITNPGPSSLTGDPSRKISGGVLTVSGVGLMPDRQAAQWCKLNSSARYDCTLPEVKPGKRVRVTSTSRIDWELF